MSLAFSSFCETSFFASRLDEGSAAAGHRERHLSNLEVVAQNAAVQRYVAGAPTASPSRRLVGGLAHFKRSVGLSAGIGSCGKSFLT